MPGFPASGRENSQTDPGLSPGPAFWQPTGPRPLAYYPSASQCLDLGNQGLLFGFEHLDRSFEGRRVGRQFELIGRRWLLFHFSVKHFLVIGRPGFGLEILSCCAARSTALA